MLAPASVFDDKTFRPWTSSPVVSLTRNLPRDVNADILLLGGDIRSVLYTTYVDQGVVGAGLKTPAYDDLPRRKLDITWCEVHDFNVVRSIVLLTIIQDVEVSGLGPELWSLYHCAFINETLYNLVALHIYRLQQFSTLGTWNDSKYGSLVRFVDQATFMTFRQSTSGFKAEHGLSEQDTEAYLQTLKETATKLETQGAGPVESVLERAALRSAGPLGSQTEDEIMAAYRAGWSLDALDKAVSRGLKPNPLFKPLAKSGASLDNHFPILGHHLATAFANLADTSPLRPTGQDVQLLDQVSESNKAVQAATLEFEAWAAAFSRMRESVTIRVVAADPLAFCQTLQAYCSSNGLTANWYRRQYDHQPIALDSATYSQLDHTPKRFDTIETASLADDVGGLNVLVSASPLLKLSASATLFTEVDIDREEDQQDVFEKVFLGSASEIGLLLGLTPVEHVTNATVTSPVDELFSRHGSRTNSKPTQQTHLQLSWKRTHQLAGKEFGAERMTGERGDISCVLYKIYKRMLDHWPPTTCIRHGVSQVTPPSYHIGCLAALIKVAQGQVDDDWEDECCRFQQMMQERRGLEFVPDFSMEFAALSAIWEVYRPALPNLPSDDALRSFHAWPQIPDVVVVNLTIPRAELVGILQHVPPTPVFMVAIECPCDEEWPRKHAFAVLQCSFGTVESVVASGSPNIGQIQNRSTPTASDDNLIVSLYAPSNLLRSHPNETSFTLDVLGAENGSSMAMILELGCFGEDAEVIVSPWLPNLTADPQLGAASKELDCEHVVKADQKQDEVDEGFVLAPSFPPIMNSSNLPYTVSYTLKVDQLEEKIFGMMAHIDVKGQKGKDLLLVDRCAVTLMQESPFMVRVTFGDSNFTPVCVFPVPVLLDKRSKPRVARQSSWVQVTVSVADPVPDEPMADFMFPNRITLSGDIVSLNLPHVNMDVLPILDLDDKERNKFLTTLVSMQFSARERVLREEAQASSATGIMPSARANFKETLMTMFMLASGVQGGQSGLMALNVEGGQGIHMLFFVSAIRLDGPTSSAVLDAAVIPVTSAMLLDSTFGDFLMALRHFEIATLIVNEDELRLWKKVLPAMVERCRAWRHSEDCAYRTAHQAPISLVHGQPVLCDCGRGKLPPGFVNDSLPGWSEVGNHCATRIAISPTFAVPLVEDLVSAENLVKMQSSRGGQERCANCGATQAKRGGPLKKCTGCFKVQYCSPGCQKKDWSKHRAECGRPEDDG